MVALTGVTGAGGFGKTTVANAVARDDRVTSRFPDGVHWVTLGEEVRGADLARRINDLSELVSGARPHYTEPEQAGQHLGAVLEGKRCLLVIDDVWRSAQLEPFLIGGLSCRRLVTTRVQGVLPADTVPVTVDAMTPEQSRELLAEGLDSSGVDWKPLVLRTGRWPLLMALANRAIHRYVRRGLSAEEAVTRVNDRLSSRGPVALDVANADQRRLAVANTVEVSLSLLAEDDPRWLDRYLELAVFAEDDVIGQETLETYWGHTAGLGAAEVEELCLQLFDLSLVSRYKLDREQQCLWLHDVMREYVRHRAVADLPDYHQALLGAYRVGLATLNGRTEWWGLPSTEPYMWSALSRHLHHAGFTTELNNTVCDFRWITAVLHRDSPAAVERDIGYATGINALALRRAIAQNAHLLHPMEPANTLAPTLLSRLHGYPELADYLTAASATIPRPFLAAIAALPDSADPALERVLPVHNGRVASVAISPDDSWLATVGHGAVRLWDFDGVEIAAFTIPAGADELLAISPDRSWLATGGSDGTVRLWNVDGSHRLTLTGHAQGVASLAISPDGAWLATAAHDGTVRLWLADGTELATLIGATGTVSSLAISPDGAWLATASHDDTVRLWWADGTHRSTFTVRTRTGRHMAISPYSTWIAIIGDSYTVHIWGVDGSRRTTFTGHMNTVWPVAISPDGAWLSTGDEDGTVRLWRPDGTELVTLAGHVGTVSSIAISPDGDWLATVGDDAVRLWRVDRTDHSTFGRYTGTVDAVAISPDGRWLATGGEDGTVRLWSVEGDELASFAGHVGPARSVAISPDGRWLASGGHDGMVQLWWADRTNQTGFLGHAGSVRSVAISSDSTWFATGGDDGMVRLWGDDGSHLATFTGHKNWVHSVAISPDDTWVAAASADETVRLWRTDGTEIATLTGHVDAVGSVDICSDGTWLATSGDDGAIRLWGSDGTELDLLEVQADHVWSVTISPDGTWLATYSNDKTVRLWESATGRCVSALRTSESCEHGVWFPDGSGFAAVGERGIFLFRLEV
ncbi:hypothetical protein GCM10027563_17420 [Parasphingorhabdus pacifica]